MVRFVHICYFIFLYHFQSLFIVGHSDFLKIMSGSFLLCAFKFMYGIREMKVILALNVVDRELHLWSYLFVLLEVIEIAHKFVEPLHRLFISFNFVV